MDLSREKDPEQLRRIARTQQLQIEQLVKVIAAQAKRIDALTGQDGEMQQALALLEQLQARAEQESAPNDEPAAPPPERKKRKARTKYGPTEQPRLPLVERIYPLDAPDLMCTSCGGELRPMEGLFDESEMIDVIDIKYVLVKVLQQKYSCRCGGCVETAPGPARAISGGRYSLELAIKIAIDKYLDHLPLSRQARIMDRYGLEVTSQTLWDQIDAVAKKLRRVWEALFAHVLKQPVIGLDQTSWKRLENRKSKPWQMWCLTSPGVVYHRICGDKGASTFTELVGNYEGVIVCDALKTHECGARDGPGIVLARCWAHVYRKFDEAKADHPEAMLAMDWIGQLYEIDERAGDDVERRGELRRTESAAVLEKLRAWLLSQATLKTLSIWNAVNYTLANWPGLTRFIADARIPLDNNGTERGIRGPVIGRRNHFGSKSKRGTEVASIFYSLVETAKLQGIDPARYLVAAVNAAMLDETLMPWQFAS